MLLLRSCHSVFASVCTRPGVETGVGADDSKGGVAAEEETVDGCEREGRDGWAAPDADEPFDEHSASPAGEGVAAPSTLWEAL